MSAYPFICRLVQVIARHRRQIMKEGCGHLASRGRGTIRMAYRGEIFELCLRGRRDKWLGP